MASDNYVDDIYAFFINCYQLKDWIRNDGTVSPTVEKAVVPYINGSRPLSLCADICNARKHLRLTSSSRPIRENPAFGKKQFGLALGSGPPTISLSYEITTDAGPIDAFQLATDCLTAWDTFLSTNGLVRRRGEAL
jgi:hypothetical protein